MKQDIVTLERQTGHRNLVMRRRFNRLLGGGLKERAAAAKAKAAELKARTDAVAALVQARKDAAAALARETAAEAAALARATAAEMNAKLAEAAELSGATLDGMTQIAREKMDKLAELAKATLRAAAARAEKEAELAQAKASRLGLKEQLTDVTKRRLIASLDLTIAIFDTIIAEYETQDQTDTKDIRALVTYMFNGALRLKKVLPHMIATALSRTHSAEDERNEYLEINNDLTQNYLHQGCYVSFDPRVYKFRNEDKAIIRGGLPERAWSNKESLTVMTHEALEESVDAILHTCTRDDMSIIDKLKEIKKLKVPHAYNEDANIFVYRFIRPFEGET